MDSTYQIKWVASPDNTTTYDIYISGGGLGPDSSLFLGITEKGITGNFKWKIPADFSIPPGSGYQIYFSSTGKVRAASGMFTIVSICKPIVVGGITYSLSPCYVSDSMIVGKEDRPFSTTIIPSVPNISYGFGVSGYGVGLPAYGILGGVSGGTAGQTRIELFFFKPRYFC